ncbi:MAG: hypothetical protein KFKLKKLM_01551 [Flavobacteriales bacterium]|nr:hypothetical protein [Flavobacteriales bacterium]
MAGCVLFFTSFTHFCMVSFPKVNDWGNPLLSTPINTVPPEVLAKATNVSITASLKLTLNSNFSFSPCCKSFISSFWFTINCVVINTKVVLFLLYRYAVHSIRHYESQAFELSTGAEIVGQIINAFLL